MDGPGPDDEPQPAALDRNGCDLPTWRHLTTRTDLDRDTVRWLVRQAGGWPDYDFAPRSTLFADLVTSPVPLTRADLVALAGPGAAEGPPDADQALRLLAHPAADLTVVCVLAHCHTSWAGGARHDQWNPRLPHDILAALVDHPSPRVRVTARVYAAGLRPWASDPDELPQYLRAQGEAHRRLLDHLALIEAAGMWEDLEQLLDIGRQPDPDLLRALVATGTSLHTGRT